MVDIPMIQRRANSWLSNPPSSHTIYHSTSLFIKKERKKIKPIHALYIGDTDCCTKEYVGLVLDI